MPSSRPGSIPLVVSLIRRLNPDTVLDVGAGFGKWGFLLREYLEVWQGRLHPDDWEKAIDAAEIFEGYRALPWYPVIYRHVYGDVRKVDLGRYDLVLWGDVIEHLSKAEGQSLLRKCRAWIVTTPNGGTDQGASFGNEAERHRSRWGVEDFEHVRVTDDGIAVGWDLGER